MAMQEAFPVSYIEPVFRPPSEAHSLILPVTNGCSWNKCTFCEMYTAPQKKFRARDEAEVLDEIRRVGERYIVNRIFLADGDAMVLPTHRLLRILEAIAEHIPSVERPRPPAVAEMTARTRTPSKRSSACGLCTRARRRRV